MPRVRLGVALLIPAPFDAEVDGMRRALDDGGLGRIPAHITLVPPVNVREDRLGAALAVLRDAAVATRPFTVAIGPPETFLPDSPTLYLALSGPGEVAVRTLRDRIFRDPLARPLTWPFIPHVTLADEAGAERIQAARTSLKDYRVDVTIDRVHLLCQGVDRVWVPIADARFAAPAVIGRGGLPVELTVSAGLDPEARALAGAVSVDVTALVVTARADGQAVGYAKGWCRGPMAHLADLVVTADHRALGTPRHLVAAFEAEAAGRGCTEFTRSPAVTHPADLL